MAKESMKAREVKRAKMVAKYAEKRAALKKIVKTGDPVEAYEAAQKLQRIPNPLAQPLQAYWPSERIYASVRDFPHPVPRDGFQRFDSGRKESKLVTYCLILSGASRLIKSSIK